MSTPTAFVDLDALTLWRLIPQDRRAWADLAKPYETHRTLTAGQAALAGDLLWRLEPQGLLVQARSSAFDPNALRGSWAVDSRRIVMPSEGIALFRLYANPTKQSGNRQGIADHDEQIAWLQRKFAGAATVLGVQLSRRAPIRARGYSVVAVQFDGQLRVEDAGALAALVARGIGRSKHLGLGLLSLAPAWAL